MRSNCGIGVVGIGAVLCLALLWAGSSQAAEASGWTGGLIGGVVVPDDELAGTGGPGSEPTLGLRSSGPFNRRLGWSADLLFTEVETRTFAGDADQWTARAALDIALRPGAANAWIVSLGGGYMDITFDAANDFWSYYASIGIGQRIPAGARTHYRWELRADRTLAKDGLRGEDVTQAQFLFSVNWGRPRAQPVVQRGSDADRDGVPDDADLCPATPIGRVVDPTGCRVDDDRDGVPDAVDECPATPAGVHVDPKGCPLDGDRDGVPDDLDRCPRTIRGIEVGADGCFLDLDRDGVHDGLDMDKCPGTPAGARVDPHGCPLDSDGDGVFDGLDRCPSSPQGSQVDANGCP